MTQLNLPYWQTAQQVQDILLDLPENQRNRALYELLWLFDFDSLDAETDSQLAVLRLLWHDPRFQHLENIKHWLEEVLNSHDNAWLELQSEIEMLLDVLHPETCRTYGDHGGMTQDAEILEPFVAKMLTQNTAQSLGMAWDCLYWNKPLCQLHPEWHDWLKNEIQKLSYK